MKLRILLLNLLIYFSFSALIGQDLIGWATLNGGTTGGLGGDTVTVTSRSELYNYAGSPNAFVIQVQDTIELNLYEMIEVKGNKTIVGLGYNAAIRYGGLQIQGDNVIIQNLEIFDSYDGDWSGDSHSTDAITVYGAKNVWIDHCWLHLSADGLLDIRSNGSNNIGDFVTVSYTRFTDHNKVMLIGASDNNTYNQGHLNTTLHHCWFDGTVEKGVNQRMPRVRFGDVHVLNNYYEDIGYYCVRAHFESDIVIENSYFRSSSDPHVIQDVGLGTKDPEIVAFENIYEYSGGSQQTSGDAFDPASHYDYTPDPPKSVPGKVMNGAGVFNPPGNQAPVAENDTVQLANLSSTVFIEVVENDSDADGGDLRLAVVFNDPVGTVGVQNNKIIYKPSPTQTEPDTLLYQLVDTQGGMDTAMVFVQLPPTGLNENFLDASSLRIFPNPTTETAIIEFSSEYSEPVEVKLFDRLGRELNGIITNQSSDIYTHTFRVDTTNLEKGNYMVNIKQGNRLVSKQLAVF